MGSADEGRDAREQAFSAMYAGHEWLGESKSGPGSDPSRTGAYRALIEAFVREHAVASVLDVGCGDWQSTRLIDWAAVSYVGVDVVADVVRANQQVYGSPSVSFRQLDAVQDELPPADLVLVKEVLQHLPIRDIQVVLAKLAAYRYALIVNDISEEVRGGWRDLRRWHATPGTNAEIEPGQYRPLDLRQAPFSVAATPLLTYANRYGNQRWVKEVLLLEGGS